MVKEDPGYGGRLPVNYMSDMSRFWINKYIIKMKILMGKRFPLQALRSERWKIGNDEKVSGISIDLR